MALKLADTTGRGFAI